jgi:hypothetical protein
VEPNADETRERTPWPVWFVGVGLLVLGAGVIYLGAHLNGLDGYERSIFVNVGTAFALIGPLFLAERALSRRIREVGDRARSAQRSAEAVQATIEATRNDVDELRRDFREGLARARAEDAARRERAAAGSFDDLVELYRRASEHRSIDRLGLRVLATDLDLALRVRAVERAPEGEHMWLIELNFEGDNLRPLGRTVVWSPTEDATEVFLRLAKELQSVGGWPGDAAFDPPALLAAISDGLGQVIGIRSGARGDRQVRQIIDVVNDDWAVTREGLDSLTSSRMWAEHDELIGNTNHAFHRLKGQVASRGGNMSNFTTAFSVAEKIHAALERGSPVA